jgi:hypothetical protein
MPEPAAWPADRRITITDLQAATDRLRETLLDATRRFTGDVSGGRYPGAEHGYT